MCRKHFLRKLASVELRSNLQRANVVIKLIVHLPAGETRCILKHSDYV
jgi:hypothetical protein